MGRRGTLQGLLGSLIALLWLATTHVASEQPKEPPFRYAAGTEMLVQDCAGELEVHSSELVFRCSIGSISVPFDSITRMQYRPDLSRYVRHLKVKWHVRPDFGSGKQNRYFTIVYKQNKIHHVIILKVAPHSMRPYLAEIELRTGKRVEVMPYEEYS